MNENCVRALLRRFTEAHGDYCICACCSDTNAILNGGWSGDHAPSCHRWVNDHGTMRYEPKGICTCGVSDAVSESTGS